MDTTALQQGQQRPRSYAELIGDYDPGYLPDDQLQPRERSTAALIGKQVNTRRKRALRDRGMRQLAADAELDRQSQTYDRAVAMFRAGRGAKIDAATMADYLAERERRSQDEPLSSAQQHAAAYLDRDEYAV